MDFGQALAAVKAGGNATRQEWAANGAHIFLSEGVIQWQSKDHPPQVYHPNAGDMLAEDWQA
ncbi:Thoeris anti-defense Tad2 family protein [Fimbriiglobus ruber]|uniref:Thoeris anti-defense 2-like domain-containing protein n=1 Tax=Fimbriiglobus ruber TaxID=1908690 RepID=A0A225E1T1_9BACT|nr:MW1434 family type I TA system toxin [Fimbriiglobus ruber]OWK36882.1 hypothetical protein FRUB_07934 [Fimbriiglobus ruber]OWK36999.1 hypothetical protein FRUB_07921 [Fimbriiglobus ruber]OWK47542.1 hypothetical protein FRUB_01241 [Fimbriiglobus ruber]